MEGWPEERERHEKAKEYLMRALVIAKDVGDKDVQARCYSNLGIICAKMDDIPEAKKYLQRALDIATKIGDKEAELNLYANLDKLK